MLFNIQGSGLKSVIHISNAGQTLTGAPPLPAENCPYTYSVSNDEATGTVNNVCDVTLLGVGRSDDLTETTITDSTLAIYALGEIISQAGTNSTTSIGYSRYTTATVGNATPWLVGTQAPATNSTCVMGTLYSCTGSFSACTEALWQCGENSTWRSIQ
jgi:hypothetical protein